MLQKSKRENMAGFYRVWRLSFLIVFSISLLACAAQGIEQESQPTKQIVENKPDKTKAANYNVQLGMGYIQQGQYERAKGKLLRALEQDPKYAPAYGAMGYFLELTGQPEAAQQYYLKAIRYSGQSGEAHNNYGAYLCRQQQYAKAIQHFQTALRDTQYTSSADALENAGLCSLKIPNLERAKYFFQRAIEEDPQRGRAYLALAELGLQAKDYDATARYLKLFSTYIPDDTAKSLWLKIQLATAQGDLDKAASYRLLLQGKYPNSPEAQQVNQA
jgi:type IV pilus assembly protein PilF